jgi:hypothetical protein
VALPVADIVPVIPDPVHVSSKDPPVFRTRNSVPETRLKATSLPAPTCQLLPHGVELVVQSTVPDAELVSGTKNAAAAMAMLNIFK